MPRKNPIKKPSRAVAVRSGKGGGGAGNTASLANLAKGKGKKGRSGRQPLAIVQFFEQELEDAMVQDTIHAILTDPSNRNHGPTLKTALAYTKGLPKATLNVTTTHRFVIAGPPTPADYEEWHKLYAPRDGPPVVQSGPAPAAAPAEIVSSDAAQELED